MNDKFWYDNKHLSNTYQIYPENCNAHKVGEGYMAHGGDIIKWADKTAAIHAAKILRVFGHNEDVVALTVSVTGCQFFRGPELGEILTVNSLAIKPKTNHRMDFKVTITDKWSSKVFVGNFSFCSFLKYENDGSIRYNLYPHEINK